MSETFTVYGSRINANAYLNAAEAAIERLHVLIATAKKLQLDRFTITLDLAIQLEALAGVAYQEIYGESES